MMGRAQPPSREGMVDARAPAVDGPASGDLNERLLPLMLLLLLPTPDAAPLLMLCVRARGK